MPAQTTQTSYVQIPDGAKVEINDGSGFVDVGAFNSDITATLNFDVNIINSSNAQIIKRAGKNMTMTWAGTLINLNPTGVAKFSGGLLTTEETTESEITTAADQTIAAGWTTMVSIPLAANDPTTGVALRFSQAPTLVVDGDTTAALVINNDYFIQADDNSFSGYSILLNSAGSKGVANTQIITIEFSTLLPIAKVTLYGGASTFEFATYEMRMTHTDDNSLVRRLNLPKVTPDSGGFQFNFKSSQSDGSEEMPITCTADLDTTLGNGKQLFSWEVETGSI